MAAYFPRILVPIDGSDVSRWVFARGLKAFAQPGAKVTVLQVVEPPPSRAGDAAYRSDPRHQPLFDEIEKLRKSLAAKGVDAVTQVRFGDPAGEILREERDGSHDLIAMTTSGRTGLGRILFGSVAMRVLHGAEAPMLLFRPQLRPFGGLSPVETTQAAAFAKIVVPLDGSDEAERVLPRVDPLVRRFGSRIHLVQTVPPGPDLPAQRERAGDYLEKRATALRKSGHQVSTEVRTGAAADELLAAATEADAVAMTTHGRSGASRAVYGSVAERLLAKAEVPVFVFRTRKVPGSEPLPLPLPAT